MYPKDSNIDQFDRSSIEHLLHQDVLDMLPRNLHLDPCGSKAQLDVLKISTSGNLLSTVWSGSATPNKIVQNG